MLDLLAKDIVRIKAQVHDRAERSDGRWRTAQVELICFGPMAKAFREGYEQVLALRVMAVRYSRKRSLVSQDVSAAIAARAV